MRFLYSTIAVLILIGAVFGILWAGQHDFGQRQSMEFFPYEDEITLDDGTTLRSSGVMVRVNHWEAAQNDQAMATLMIAANNMYPEECSGENYEIAVRRPNPDGGEEKYSFTFSIYENDGAGSWIEYGRWVNDRYVVMESYNAEWIEIINIAQGRATFQIQVE